MQDLLLKIVEMDEHARQIEKEAQQEKLKSEQDIEALRDQIYNDYIERAKDRVEKNIAVDKAHAEQHLEAYKEQVEVKKQALNALYEENKENWVNEIVSRTLN